MPKVSVVMSVYNTPADFLSASIESILNQTFSDFEFLIIDDGSTDENVKKIILSYDDKRIKYLYKNNSGLTASLNYGLEHATGEYIARMDADDISLPTRFEKQVKYLDEHKDVAVLGTWFEMFGSSNIVIKHPEVITVFNILNDEHVGHPTVMFRKKMFDDHKLRYDEDFKCAQDFELWSRVVRILKVRNLPEILLKYRMSEKNISTIRYVEQQNNAKEVKNRLLEFLTTDKKQQVQILNIINTQKPIYPKWLIILISCFIPSKKYRHNLKKKYIRKK